MFGIKRVRPKEDANRARDVQLSLKLTEETGSGGRGRLICVGLAPGYKLPNYSRPCSVDCSLRAEWLQLAAGDP